MIISYSIERERERVIQGLDVKSLSNPQNIEKAQMLESLIIEYFNLRQCKVR